MPLQIPSNFARDIKSKNTNLYPLVIIGNYELNADNPLVGISTNSGKLLNNYDVNFLPLLLNVPSIKESIDISGDRKYKISSINLDISNAPYSDKRFSEIISNNFNALINTEVRMFWASPSVTDITYFDIMQSYADESRALQVFYGIVRRYEHSIDKVKIVVEDQSQLKLHKDLPYNKIGASNNIPDKYKNKPYPLVYGEVDRSPCVIDLIPRYNEDDDTLERGEIRIAAEAPNQDLQNYNDLFILKNEKYANVPQGFGTKTFPNMGEKDDATWSGKTGETYDIGNNKQFALDDINSFILKSNPVDEGAEELSPISFNRVIAYEVIKPTTFEPLQIESSIEPSTPTTKIIYQSMVKNNILKGTLVKEYAFSDYNGSSLLEPDTGHDTWGHSDYNAHRIESMVGCTMPLPIISESEYLDHIGYIRSRFQCYHYNGTKYEIGLPSGDVDYFRLKVRFGGNQKGDHQYNRTFDNETITAGTESVNTLLNTAWTHNSFSGDEVILVEKNPACLLFHMRIVFNWGQTAIEAEFDEIEYEHWMLVDGLIDQDFYVYARGRPNYNNTSPMRTIHEIINDILIKEVKFDPKYTSENQIGWVSEELALQASSEFSVDNSYTKAINHDFTISESINSKKLIEELCSASPYIPTISAISGFSLNKIPPDGRNAGGQIDWTIKESDCIDFSFTRTPIEEVYTKIEFHYNYDYGTKKFRNQVPEIQLPSTSLELNYYNLSTDHKDSTLVVDDHRGKYLRNASDAMSFANWLLSWHRNQKLVMNIKLPLSVGLKLEVGDIINFDKLLGNVEPYGINYMNDTNGFIAGQRHYSTFIITNTSKSLTDVSIEAIHLHKLNFSSIDIDNCYDGNGICIEANCPRDECGVCGGDNSTCADECGVPNGDNTTCFGCMDSEACNYDPNATISDTCLYESECYDCNNNCTCDVDDDGECDDEDTCIGQYDACGVCNGAGPTYEDCAGEKHCTEELRDSVQNGYTFGCMNPNSANYNNEAVCSDDSCEEINTGSTDICLDPNADNYLCVEDIGEGWDLPDFDLLPRCAVTELGAELICNNDNLDNCAGIWDMRGSHESELYQSNNGELSVIQQVQQFWHNGCYNNNCDVFSPIVVLEDGCDHDIWNMSGKQLILYNENDQEIRSINITAGNFYVDLTPYEIRNTKKAKISFILTENTDPNSSLTGMSVLKQSSYEYDGNNNNWHNEEYSIEHGYTFEENNRYFFEFDLDLHKEWEEGNIGYNGTEGFEGKEFIKYYYMSVKIGEHIGNTVIPHDGTALSIFPTFRYQGGICFPKKGDINNSGTTDYDIDLYLMQLCVEGQIIGGCMDKWGDPINNIFDQDFGDDFKIWGCAADMNNDGIIDDDDLELLEECILQIETGHYSNCEDWMDDKPEDTGTDS